MARTVDMDAHELKRDEFLNAAESMLRTKGFDRVSVQDLLSITGASKGAFYHYFDSKQNLLEVLAERMADRIASDLRQAVDAPDLSAPERLNHLFAMLGTTKLRHRDSIIGLLRIWYSDANAAVRQRLRSGISDRIAPLLTAITVQGVSEGAFTTELVFGRVLSLLIQDLNDELGKRFLQSEAKGEPIDELMSDAGTIVETYTSAIERILGADPGSVQLVNLDMLRAWFKPDN